MSKVLLAAPVSKYKEYVLFDWIRYIKKLDGEYDILLIDNSMDISFHRKIRKMGVACMYHKPRKNEPRLNETIANCSNELLDYFLKGEYTHFFSLECDVFPPKDIIVRLLSHGVPVVSAMYFIGNGNNIRPMIQVADNEWTIVNSDFEHVFWKITGGLTRTVGCGKGCLMIAREVFENTGIRFRVEPDKIVHDDTFLAKDLYDAEIPVMVDTSLYCTHYQSMWNEINKKHKNLIR